MADIEPYGNAGLMRARITDFGTSLYVIYNPDLVKYETLLITEDGDYLNTEDEYFIKLSGSNG